MPLFLPPLPPPLPPRSDRTVLDDLTLVAVDEQGNTSKCVDADGVQAPLVVVLRRRGGGGGGGGEGGGRRSKSGDGGRGGKLPGVAGREGGREGGWEGRREGGRARHSQAQDLFKLTPCLPPPPPPSPPPISPHPFNFTFLIHPSPPPPPPLPPPPQGAEGGRRLVQPDSRGDYACRSFRLAEGKGALGSREGGRKGGREGGREGGRDRRHVLKVSYHSLTSFAQKDRTSWCSLSKVQEEEGEEEGEEQQQQQQSSHGPALSLLPLTDDVSG